MKAKFRAKLWQYAPLGLVALTAIILFSFNQFYLSRLTNQLAESFQIQHYQELQSGDTYGLTAKLNALSEDAQWKCIVASKDGGIFFEHHTGKSCGSNVWQRHFEIAALGMPGMRVGFTISLPPEIKFANSAVFVLQLFLFSLLIKISRKSELEKHLADLHVARVAQQVSHDIRSPLAALDVAVSSIAELPEEKRILIRNAVSRIRDIANNLVERSRKAEQQSVGAQNESEQVDDLSVQLLPSLVDALVSEKRTQYRSQIGVEIEVELDHHSYGLFAKVNAAEFKRVLSNIINNSVEALSGSGNVRVQFFADPHFAKILVSDNGKGIASDILPQLMPRGASFNKENGSGLGLYHAKTTLESWGAQLSIASELEKGTAVTLTLPRAESPTWFMRRLKISRDATVVILDDDISIHDIWAGRLKQLALQHFSTVKELRNWCRTNQKKKNILYLVDYELAGQSASGLDLIEEFGLARHAILVTSRFESPEILHRCQNLQIKLIPKPMAGFVPLELTEPKKQVQLDAILIDDDTDMHFAWNLSAKTLNKSIKTYASPSDFLQDAEAYHGDTPIYIDSNLKNGEKGEQVSKTLYDLGFTELYLATGFQPEKFGQLPWIKEVVGKAPPW